MGISKSLKEKISCMSADEVERIVRMCWEDRSSFESIQLQFSMTPNQVVKLMRSQLDDKAFRRWRRRIYEQGHLKNEIKTGIRSTRFKCSRQSVEGFTKGWK